jgi:hypothetical protein
MKPFIEFWIFFLVGLDFLSIGFGHLMRQRATEQTGGNLLALQGTV